METQQLEWKEAWHDDYLKWICGFANAQGGTLVIGKTKNQDEARFYVESPQGS
jgi:ATP-dependent DNA helicase RecG